MLQPHVGAVLGERAATLYLVRGWLKVGTVAGPGTAGVASPALDLQRFAGVAVLRVAPTASMLFVESGSAQAAEVQDGRAVKPQSLGNGDAFVKRANETAALARRPPAELLKGLPRAFADSLPRRAARFQAHPVEPGAAHAGGLCRGVALAERRAGAAHGRSSSFHAARCRPRVPRIACQRAARPPRVGPRAVSGEVPAQARGRGVPRGAGGLPAQGGFRHEGCAAADPAPVTVGLQGVMSWPSAARDFAPNSTMETR